MHIQSFVKESEAVEFASFKRASGYIIDNIYPPLDKNTHSITGRWIVWWH